MQAKLFALTALFTTLFLGSPTLAAEAEPEKAKAAIRAIGETWRELYRAGRYSEIPMLYTSDTLVMPRGRPIVVGRNGMRKAVGGLAAGRKVEIDVRERDITLMGDYALYVGDFTVTYTPPDGDKRPAVTEEARSMVLFRHDEDGKWRIHRDMDSPAPHLLKKVISAFADAPKWTGADRSEPTQCDILVSSKYDRQRLADPMPRGKIDVPAAIKQCLNDLKKYPNDPRLHFHLGRIYGYTDEKAKSKFHRVEAAKAGNHNAIFLLGYLDWMRANTPVSKCQAATEMREAAERGNYSGQVTYASYFFKDALDACDTPSVEIVKAYLDKAQPQADGFFERLLVQDLKQEADRHAR